MRQCALDLHHLIRRQQLVAAQNGLQRFETFAGPAGEICQRTGFGFTILVILLTQQDG
jgi:hypothetical protein